MRSIDRMWAWVTIDPSGQISFIGAELPGIGNVPLVHHNESVIDQTKEFAEAHAKLTGQRVWKREYVRTVDHDPLEPK